MALRNGAGLGGGESDFQSMSEINVTPLVDVMLVLLIIFMVTAPFMLQSVKVKLPETGPVAPLKASQALVVSVQADGAASLGREAIELEALEARLKAELQRERRALRATARRRRGALRPHHRGDGGNQPRRRHPSRLRHRHRAAGSGRQVTPLLRIAAALARVEPRHWAGLGASVALHLAVVLGWRQAPPPEPEPISFEIALEPLAPANAPRVDARAKSVVKAARKTQAKKRVAEAPREAREPHTLDASWRGERKPAPDMPAVALPDARALGIEAASLAPATPGGARAATRAAPTATVTPADQPVAAPAELSEPDAVSLAASAPATPAGIVLSASAQLAEAREVSMTAAGAQGGEAGATLAHAGGAEAPGLEAAAPLAAGTAATPATTPTPAAGATMAGAAPASAVRSGAEPDGLRLHASGSLATPASGATPAGVAFASPAAVANTSVVHGSSGDGGGAPLAFAGSVGAASLNARADNLNAGARVATVGAAASTSATGGSRAGAGREIPGALRTARAVGPAVPAGAPGGNGAPAVARGGGKALALSPGEPGGSPGMAVAMRAVLATPHALAGARGGTRRGDSGAGAATAGGEASARLATVDAGGGDSRPPGAVAAGGARPTSATVAAGGSGAGEAPVVLRATHAVAVQVMRPDSEIERLDVLAPSSFCPLPGFFPDNRPVAHAPVNDSLPSYGDNNPNFHYPLRAWAYNHEGRVTLRVEVLPDGRAGQMLLKQSSGSGILDQDAREQLARWRFTPARRNGQAVTAWIDVPVIYRLKETADAGAARNPYLQP
jgi:TonB family protein